MIESRGRPAPPVPAGFEGSALFDGIYWHQCWEVFEGVYLPGRNDVHRLLEYVGLPADLTGKRVLDVGAWNGGFSFECERRGASEVVALSLEDPETTGFNRLQAVLGSKVSYALESVYNLDPEVLGQFDVVLFLGVLYRSVTSGELFIETHVIDECFISAGKTSAESQSLATISTSLSDVPLWQFYRRDELGGDPSNWFGPNVCGVLEGFGSAGFDVGVTHRWGTRAGFRATPVPRADFERTYEGQSPVLQKGLKLRLADPPASGTT